MPMEDIWDRTVITNLIRRNVQEEAQQNLSDEDRAFIGQTLAPLVPVQSRVARIRVSEVLPYGLGQFKAPDATPPLFKTKPTLTESVIEMVDLDEMERFTGTEWTRLNSNDPAIARGALLDLVTRMTIMNTRNELLTEWMRWQAFKGVMVVTYPDGGQLTVDYGFQSSHLPTSSVAWTDTTNADPLGDIYAYAGVGVDDLGRYLSNVFMNNHTWQLIVYNQKIRGYLSQLGREILLPSPDDMQQLLKGRTASFTINDSGYLPEGATNHALTKFLPDNRVLFTASNTINGQRIADMADGQVLVGGDTGQAPAIQQGMSAELIGNPFSKNVFRRVASARIPRIYYPDAFLYATVGA